MVSRVYACLSLMILSAEYRVGCDCAGQQTTIPDAGAPDAGLTDAGEQDAGRADSGIVDAGAACQSIQFVRAVPNTGVFQVMQQSSIAIESLTENAGDVLVAVAYGGQGPGSSTPTTAPNMKFTVSDTLGNTYYAGPFIENPNHHEAAIQIFYALNVDGGTNTVTFASAAPAALTLWTGLFLQEYSGLATSNVVDVSSAQSAPDASFLVTPGSMTTSAECDVVVGAFTDGNVDAQSLDAGAGWVFRSTDDWDPGAAVDNAPAGAVANSSVNAVMSLTLGPDDGWVATQVAFRALNTTSPPQPTQIAFATPPRPVVVNTCSPVVTLESRNSSAAVNTAIGINVTLSGSGLSFFVDSNCVYPTSSLFIGAGTSAQSFYFSGSNLGTSTLFASAPGMAQVTQAEDLH